VGCDDVTGLMVGGRLQGAASFGVFHPRGLIMVTPSMPARCTGRGVTSDLRLSAARDHNFEKAITTPSAVCQRDLARGAPLRSSLPRHPPRYGSWCMAAHCKQRGPERSAAPRPRRPVDTALNGVGIADPWPESSSSFAPSRPLKASTNGVYGSSVTAKWIGISEK